MRFSQIYSILVVLTLVLASATDARAQATYRLTFDSQWSPANHPGAYPGGAHFSPLIGGTHNDTVSYWELGGIASAAIEQMAETGGTSQLRNVVLNDVNNTGAGGQLVTGPGINGPGTGMTNFTVSSDHPLLTLVTMIAPSPDWFVGVSGLDFRQDGQWIESLSFDLNNYDSGTDAGVDFTSGNIDTTPHVPIAPLGAPLAGLPPVGTFTFELTSTTTALCDFNGDNSCSIADLNELLSVGPIAAGVPVTFGTNNQYDINGDGTIDLADRDDWLAGAAAENGFSSPFSPADADLNGVTDGVDFIAWNENKFSASLAASAGDFNGDGFVDGVDFITWNENRFTSSGTAAVPEPSALAMFMIAGLLLVARRK